MEANTRRYICQLRYYGLLITVLPLAQFALAEGGIATDGTIGGAAQTLSLPGDTHHVTINQNSGETVGNNLFHSFAQFNINTGQTVTFTGDAAIQNVISRVTGGEASSIDGTLKSDIGQAAVYFINPAGIVFGQHAKVDVPGAFYASTANELQFADGSKFSATNQQASSLSMAAPAAFGFLGAQTGTLALNGANLEFKSGVTVQFSANQINLENFKLSRDINTPEGQGLNLQLVAVGNSPQSIGLNNLPKHALQGALNLRNTILDSSGNGKERISIRAGNVSVLNSLIFADNTGKNSIAKEQGIDIQVKNLDLNNSKITSDTVSDGDAGNIAIYVEQALLMDKAASIHSLTSAQGNTATIDVKADELTLNDNSSIYTQSTKTAASNAGNIKIEAGKLQIENKAFILSRTDSQGNSGNINVNAQLLALNGENSSIQTFASNTSTGNSGAVNVVAAQIKLSNKANFLTQTDGKGNGGSLNVKGKTLELNDSSAIKTLSSTSASGNAGEINIAVDSIQMNDKAEIRSQADSNGNSGHLEINATNISIDRQSGIKSYGNSGSATITAQEKMTLANGSSIASSVIGSGNSNTLKINAQTLQLNNSADILSVASGKGNASDIEVHAGTIALNGNSSIKSAADNTASGNSGSIGVQANNIQMQNNTSITSKSDGKGSSGSVDIGTKVLDIDNSKIVSATSANSTGITGNINIQSNNIKLNHGAEIYTQANAEQDGGNLRLTTGTLEMLGKSNIGALNGNKVTKHNDQMFIKASNTRLGEASSIITAANSEGNARDIILKTESLELNGNSSILSIAPNPRSGNTGDIQVDANILKMNDKSFITSLTNAPSDTGNIYIKSSILDLNGGSKIFANAPHSVNGKAGQINIDSNNIQMNNGATISSYTDSQGSAGNVRVESLVLALDGGSSISSNAWESSLGNSGKVTVRANEITSNQNSAIYTLTDAQGNAGNVEVEAGTLKLDGSSKIASYASKTSTGNSGQLSIHTDQLNMDNSTAIATQTDSSGSAGDVSVAASTIDIKGASSIKSYATNKTTSGNAGQILIQANNIQMANSSISSSSDGLGNNGNINIKAESMINNISAIQSSSQKNVGSITLIVPNQLTLSGGGILSSNDGNNNASKVIVESGKIRIQDNAIIASSTAGQGNSSDVFIKAGNISISGNSYITSATKEQSTGNAGNVTVNIDHELNMNNKGAILTVSDTKEGRPGDLFITAGQLNMNEQSQIASLTFSDKSSDINVKAQTIKIDGNSLIGALPYLDAKSNVGSVLILAEEELILDNSSSIAASTVSKGNAGLVTIHTGNLKLNRESAILANTVAQGNGGLITIRANNVSIDNSSHIDTVSGRSELIPVADAHGNAGNIDMEVKNDLTLKNGSLIASTTLTEGNAGTIQVNAGNIKLEGIKSVIFSTADTGSSGNAGNISVTAQDELQLLSGGQIASSTMSNGNAGSLDIKAGTIRIDGQKENIQLTGIASSSQQGGTGKSGLINVNASKAIFLSNGDISTFSEAVRTPSEKTNMNGINVTAPQITLANNSKISTSAKDDNGGPISINASDWLFLNSSKINTSVTGSTNGNGGDITLNSDVLVMNSGFIQANTTAPLANGGNINLNVKQLVAGQDNLQRGGSTPLTFIPNSGLNVIQAASPTGINGNINISAPQLNIVGALVGLNTPELDLNRVGRDPCSDTVRNSTFKKLGKGGVPMFNKGQDGYTIDNLLDVAPHDAANTQQSANLPSQKQDCKPKPA